MNKAIYAIGDVQGCYEELCRLLDKLQFDTNQHELWFVGDLINRGPDSLSVLRLLKSLDQHIVCVLGNHDFYLLALHYSVAIQAHHTLGDILAAPDREELVNWLQHRPLLHHAHDHTLVHAGIAPQWDLATAQRLASEVESVLQTRPCDLLKHMYGNTPACWQEDLSSYERWRCIINYFTRMRCCKIDGTLNLSFKGPITDIPPGYIPWFRVTKRKMQHHNIIFGHWASLLGQANTAHIFAIDTGCVWGHALTAIKLETHQTIATSSIK